MIKKQKLIVLLIIFSLFFSCKAASTENKDNNIKQENEIKVSDSILSLQDQLRKISKEETNSVVFISTEKLVSRNDKYFDPFEFFFDDKNNNKDKENDNKKKEYKQGGLGSGLIYKIKNNKYYILTNHHVVDGVDKIKVMVSENKSYDGKIIASDPDVDIAVIEITTKDELRVAKVGDSDKLQTGDFVIAIGNPYGLQGTMTFGIISALGRSDINTGKTNLTNFIQTDAAINPGNSGGPLLNIQGEVIGINTLIYSQSGGSVGIGFAIPINIVKKIADQIIEKGKVEHGWLGIYFEELNEEKINTLNLKNIKNGMLVTEVFEGSPAEKSGIVPGDVAIELNGVKLVKSSDLVLAIGNSTPGTEVSLKILRDGQIVDKKVILGDRNEFVSANKDKEKLKGGEAIEDYGMKLTDLDESLRAKYKIPKNLNGAIITELDPRGIANAAGIKPGDLIYKINNEPVKSVEDLKKILKDKKEANYFFIYRNGRDVIVKM